MMSGKASIGRLKYIFFNEVLIEGKMPEVWRNCYVVPIFKGEGDIYIYVLKL